MTTFFTSSERSTEEWQVIVTVRDIPSANVEAPRSATVAARMGAGLDVMSTAAIPAVRGTTARRRQVAEARGVEFATDSPLEGDGFEPSVPRERNPRAALAANRGVTF
jgi:hypothetical protein